MFVSPWIRREARGNFGQYRLCVNLRAGKPLRARPSDCKAERDKTIKRPTMTAGMPPSTSEKPHMWDETQPPPPESLRLWAEVGSGLERSQTGECFRFLSQSWIQEVSGSHLMRKF